MAAKFKYKAQISEDGKLEKIFGSRGFYQDLKLFAGKSVWIEISRFTKTRSEQQNKFYFGNYVESQIECFKEFWGENYTKEQVHDWNKANIFCEEKLVGDEVIKVPRSSTESSTIEWEEALERGRQFFLSTFDWQLPYPLQQEEFKF